ncbi:MAG: HlyD family efflux transporter periplasmic adaptor subunit [Oscillospiraceae bacterium]|nr:HlyD family efflux transporter periplasmic adaptor subunit [Oscillospiraceae bacterium]
MENRETAKSSGEGGKHVNRREWVKNIIIVFLLIMLVLTFFSNTIMNYSLPEVSVSRMSRDKVSRTFKLDLLVEANKTYSVTADESRDIKRVAVRRGQKVTEGQTLFFLEEIKDSTEARQLQETLDAEKAAYEKALISASEDYFSLNQAVQIARDKLNQAIEDKNRAESEPKEDPSAVRENMAKKAKLEADLEKLQNEEYSSLSSDTYGRLSDAHKAFVKAESEYKTAENTLNSLREEYLKLAPSGSVKPLERGIEEQKLKLTQMKSDLSKASDEASKNALSKEIESLELQIKYAEEDLTDAKKLADSASKAETVLAEKEKTFSAAAGELEKKKNETAEYLDSEIAKLGSSGSDGYDSLPGGSAGMEINYDEQIRTARYELDAAVNALSQQRAQDGAENARNEVELSSQRKKIAQLEEDLEKLLSKQSSTEIKAPVDGVVEEVKFTSGQTFAENEELMVLNISDDGFTATAGGITAEQSKSLSKGKEAKVTDGNGKVKVTVRSIAKDQSDSSKFKVTFNIEGDVTAGQTIKAELGDAPASYDRVVPRNAVNNDSSGDFVYVVKSKSTPLGNRYIVDKVQVTVIAQDDTQCAVNGDFGDSADYIITASSRPFIAGDQVRFAQE